MTVQLTDSQHRLLAAIGGNGFAPMRLLTRCGRVLIGGRSYPLTDLHVLRGYKLIRRRPETRPVPAALWQYQTTDSGQHLIDTARPTVPCRAAHPITT